MRRLLIVSAASVFTCIALTAAPRAPKPGVDWPQFRGIAAAGVAEGFSLPTTWNAADKTNVVWKSRKMGVSLADDEFSPDSLSR